MDCSPRSGRILLVASDENFRRTIGRILCRCGYATDSASSGEEAVSALGEQRYDLVVSEVRLPGICGLTVLCNARQHGRRIPFILLTEAETERMRWIVSGIDGVRCLGLPVDLDQLKETVAACLASAA
jgi:DNA-binding response OmpR family regulator